MKKVTTIILLQILLILFVSCNVNDSETLLGESGNESESAPEEDVVAKSNKFFEAVEAIEADDVVRQEELDNSEQIIEDNDLIVSNIVDIIKFQVTNLTASFIIELDKNDQVEIIVDDMTNGNSHSNGEYIPDDSNLLQLELMDLEPSTEYRLTISNESADEIIDFTTFSNNNIPEIFYQFILLNSDEHQVKIFINGHGLASYDSFKELPRYEFGHGAVAVIEDSVKVNGEVYTLTDMDTFDIDTFDIDISNIGDDFFTIEYCSDKGPFSQTGNNVISGYFDDTIFIAQGDMILLSPYALNQDSPDTEALHFWFGATTLKDWVLDLSGQAKNTSVTYLESDSNRILVDRQFFAYNPEVYSLVKRQMEDTEVRLVYHHSYMDENVSRILNVIEDVNTVWGGSNPALPVYRIYVCQSAETTHGHMHISSGESEDGQGISFRADDSAYFPADIVCHQYFHIFNAWLTGMDCEDFDGMWIEGFNVFYNYKADLKYNGSKDIGRNNYSDYISSINEGRDRPIFSQDAEVMAAYYKGFVYAYDIDRTIRSLTNDEYCMDDVLQYFWNGWLTEGLPYSNQRLLVYLNSITDNQFNQWWQDHVIENKPVIIEDFEG